MASIEEALARTADLLGLPDYATLPKETRLANLVTGMKYFAGRMKRSRFPRLVDKFKLTLDGSPNYALPVDAVNFGGLFYVTSDPEIYPNDQTREIEIVSLVDSNLTNSDGTTTGYCDEIAETGVGELRRLVALPRGAVDNLVVWYRILPNDRPLLADEIQLQEQFHLGLLPAYAALLSLPHCTWMDRGLGDEQASIKRQELLDPQNPLSLPGLLTREEGAFVEDVDFPNQAHASAKICGSGSRRRRLRRRFV